MIKVPGYQIQRQFHSGERSTIFKAMRNEDFQPVLIKVASKSGDRRASERLYWEYVQARNLSHSNLIEYLDYIETRRGPVLIIENFGAHDLRHDIPQQGLDFPEFLVVAGALLKAVAAIHEKGLIHGDIWPGNLVTNDSLLKIIDFGSATHLELDTPMPANSLEALAYKAPEQMGRMNRPVDYRSDYYGLGATFYGLLAGGPPFTNRDYQELAHFLTVREPYPLMDLREDLDDEVVAVIEKLMARQAEDRYQSIEGIERDLRALEQGNRSFLIGQEDHPSRFLPSHRLFGRDKELGSLVDAFGRVDRGECEIVLIKGPAGCGKTSLVKELAPVIAGRRGYLASGRFEAGGTRAYSALAHAFGDLIKQIASEDEKTPGSWNESLGPMLGPYGGVLGQLIPELSLLIDSQPAVANLDPRDLRHRFNSAFRNFITIFASEEHSLILFLDDIHYADSASLQLLEFLFSQQDIGHLLLIGALDNENLPEDHSLELFINRIEGETASVHTLHLADLDQQHTSHMLAADLGCSPDDPDFPAEQIYRHTKGNPLFYRELLYKLSMDEVLHYSREKRHWAVKQDELDLVLQHADMTALMIARWNEMPPHTRDLLQLALCIGEQFDRNTLMVVNEMEPADCARALWPAVAGGLIRADGLHSPAEPPIKPVHPIERNAAYCFNPSSLRSRVLALIPETRKIENHLRLGRHQLQARGSKVDNSRIFEIVHQLNLGRSLITEPSELDALVQLNSEAALRANESNAPRQAMTYLEAAMDILTEKSWERSFDLAFDVHRDYVLACYMCSEFKQAEKVGRMLLERARTPLQKVDLLQIQAEQGIMTGDDATAIKVCLEGLRLLGQPFPGKPSWASVLKELLIVRRDLDLVNPRDILNRPEMTDPVNQAIMRLFTRMITPAFTLGRASLFALALLRRIRFTFQHGNCPESANALIGYALLLCSRGKLADAERMADAGLALGERYDDSRFRCRLYATYSQVVAWTRHPNEVRRFLKKAIDAGSQAGGLVYMAYSLADLSLRVREKNLDMVIRTIERNMVHVRRLKHRAVEHICRVSLQFYKSLRGDTHHPFTLSDDHFDEDSRLREIIRDKALIARVVWLIARLKMGVCYGEYKEALKVIDQITFVRKNASGRVEVMEAMVFGALAYTGAYNQLDWRQKLKARRFIHKTYRLLSRLAVDCSTNYGHLVLLLQAERARLDNKTFRAAKAYARSMEHARRSQHPFFEALAGEMAARFHLERQEHDLASGYLAHVYDFYRRWGARAKQRSLEEQYGRSLLKDRMVNRPGNDQALTVSWAEETIQDGFPTTTTSTTRAGLGAVLLGSSSQDLDLATVTKSSSAISSEMDMPGLVDRVMRIILENVGGQRGFMLLENRGRLQVQAAVDIDSMDGIVQEKRTLEEEQGLPAAVVRYVQRTAEPVVLRDAAREGSFTDDPYIARSRPRSILCTAIITEGNVGGVLYLENNLTAGAFTGARVQVLQILLAQAAISLRNARLFEGARQSAEEARKLNQELEFRVEERTAQLEATQRQLIERAHQAGMADLASTVLHNVGNILSSVNTSCHMIRQSVLTSKLKGIHRANDMLRTHMDDLSGFFVGNPQGPNLLQYYMRLGDAAAKEQDGIEQSVKQLLDRIHAIKDAILAQQSYASIGFQDEPVQLDKVIDDALNMQDLTLTRRDIHIERKYAMVPPVCVQRVKLIHIVVNLIKNSIEAMSEVVEKRITIRLYEDDSYVYACFTDTGMGVAPENLDKIFNYGFTTKEDGHGFGLHGSANAMTEMNGAMWVESDGLGEGATFVLQFTTSSQEESAAEGSS